MTAASHYASKMRSKSRNRALDSQGMPAVLADRIDQLVDLSTNLSPVWAEVGRVWAERERKVFATGSFGRWAPLKVSTIIEKRREGATTEPLVRTHTLLTQLSNEQPRSAGEHFAVYGPQRGAAIEYAKFHMRGMGVPQRHPVPRLTATERKRMLEKMAEHMGFRP